MKKETALNVQKGINQPDVVNNSAINRFRQKKHRDKTAEEYFLKIREGNITALSQAITLIESNLPKHKKVAQEIIAKCLPYSENSIRIGFTGVPGVGKSTLIETLGLKYIEKGKKIAILAIDPSSERSGGSILGDKTRMEKLSVEKNAFIRPSPSSGSLGGVSRKTAETIILCEAAGFDTIFIETVGVGQSEIAVHSMVDFFLLLMLAGAGDELQGIKRGIMEMADAIVITKADGDNLLKAQSAKTEYKNALHLFPPTESGWIPKVTVASAKTKEGVENILTIIEDYISFTKSNGFFSKKRACQAKYRMHETIFDTIKSNFYENEVFKNEIREFEKQISEDKITPYIAASKLLEKYFD